MTPNLRLLLLSLILYNALLAIQWFISFQCGNKAHTHTHCMRTKSHKVISQFFVLFEPMRKSELFLNAGKQNIKIQCFLPFDFALFTVRYRLPLCFATISGMERAAATQPITKQRT